jgi:Family of unknown function (DUF5677)
MEHLQPRYCGAQGGPRMGGNTSLLVWGPRSCFEKAPLVAEINKAEYLTLAEKLVQVADDIFKEAKVAEDDKLSSNPKIIAVTLLCRTVNNFAAAWLLLENNFIVEARTVLRCCYENFFWLAGLSAKGSAFVDEMIADHETTRLRRGRELLEWAEKQAEPVAFEEKLSDYLDQAAKTKEEPSKISHLDAVKAGGIGEAFVIYRVLGTDAAHPSITSLDRHLRDDGEDVITLVSEPPVLPEEMIETLDFCCSALLSVCVAVNAILGGTGAGSQLPSLLDDYKRISRTAPEPKGRGSEDR